MDNATTESTPLLSELAGDADMAELIEMFVAELPERVAALRQALTERDFEALRRLAHQLKGAAGGYGFPSITEAAKDLEITAKTDRSLEKTAAEMQALAGLCARARATAP